MVQISSVHRIKKFFTVLYFSIEFVVVVEGASSLRLRRSKAAQDVFVRMRETPYFEIRYVF